MPQTLYQILDVTEAASEQEIKAAYRQAVLRHHPDKSAALGTPTDALKYQELQNAWQILKDPATRAAYNQQLALAAAQQQVFVSQTISLADMELPSEDSSEHSYTTCLQYPCRCGGAYWLDPHSIGATEDNALLPCDTCSLYVEVCKTCL